MGLFGGPLDHKGFYDVKKNEGGRSFYDLNAAIIKAKSEFEGTPLSGEDLYHGDKLHRSDYKSPLTAILKS